LKRYFELFVTNELFSIFWRSAALIKARFDAKINENQLSVFPRENHGSNRGTVHVMKLTQVSFHCTCLFTAHGADDGKRTRPFLAIKMPRMDRSCNPTEHSDSRLGDPMSRDAMPEGSGFKWTSGPDFHSPQYQRLVISGIFLYIRDVYLPLFLFP